jgi:beta-keto acid cleavage enzyme
MSGFSRQEPFNTNLMIGPALTGAKFTPANHISTGDPVFDPILRGDCIPVHSGALLGEIRSLYSMGARYFHVHARNPQTREQTCNPQIYCELGRTLRNWNPEIILSFGGSRNGREIAQAIRQGTEWSRMVHAAHPRHEGGGDFVTIQAAAELQIPNDLERRGYLRYPEGQATPFELTKDLAEYIPDSREEKLSIGAHFTPGGGDSGSSSARTQLEVLQRAIAVRGDLALPQEVEWTQLVCSYALTKLALDHFQPGLGNTGRLNITILFGFSPLLPFRAHVCGLPPRG